MSGSVNKSWQCDAKKLSDFRRSLAIKSYMVCVLLVKPLLRGSFVTSSDYYLVKLPLFFRHFCLIAINASKIQPTWFHSQHFFKQTRFTIVIWYLPSLKACLLLLSIHQFLTPQMDHKLTAVNRKWSVCVGSITKVKLLLVVSFLAAALNDGQLFLQAYRPLPLLNSNEGCCGQIEVAHQASILAHSHFDPLGAMIQKSHVRAATPSSIQRDEMNVQNKLASACHSLQNIISFPLNSSKNE